MIYLYAGLGMAMMAAIVGMMEVATQITSQPFRSDPMEDIYKTSPARSNDQRFLELLSSLSGRNLGTQDALCQRLLCEIGDAGQCLPDEAAGDSFLDLADYATSSSRSSLHPRLEYACILVNIDLGHKVLLSPISLDSTDYRLYSCLLDPRDKEVHPEQSDKCKFEVDKKS